MALAKNAPVSSPPPFPGHAANGEQADLAEPANSSRVRCYPQPDLRTRARAHHCEWWRSNSLQFRVCRRQQ